MSGAVDFNADLGESYGRWELGADNVMLECITSANVACGFHAGDPVHMSTSVDQIGARGIALGAHPGYPDLLGFGRRFLHASPSEIQAYVIYQIGALQGFAQAFGLTIHHVKPHGALYVESLQDEAVALAVAQATASTLPETAIYTLRDSAMWKAAEESGLRPVAEFFADRPLRADGSYVFFDWIESFDLDPTSISDRVVRAVTEGAVETVDGGETAIDVETVCLHSDTPGAEDIGPTIHAALTGAGVRLEAP